MASVARETVLVPFPARSLARELPAGRLVELSGSRACARVTTAVAAVRQAQLEGETTAWIQPAGGLLYPPDLHEHGVDLAALAVVQVPEHAGPSGPLRAAELLLHSGAFGLVVVDLRREAPKQDAAWQGRLLGFAREHESRVLFLTRKSESIGSLGPLVSLRVEPKRRRAGTGRFVVEHRVLKNKQGLALHGSQETHRGPWGLR